MTNSFPMKPDDNQFIRPHECGTSHTNGYFPPPGPGCYPPPPAPGCCPPPPPMCDCFNPIPPVPSVLEGQSLYEALNIQAKRVNECIQQWNCISANCYEYMKKIVCAARMNGVYYDDCEVKFNRGYDETEGCAYSIIRKKAVDSKNQPIFVKLAPAFDNPTNSGITQGIFDVSFIKSANMIITAVDPSQTKWNGPAMWKGAPIPGEENTTGYVYGFNKQGALRVFQGNVTETILCQNQMEDVIGGCTPIIMNNAITEQAELMTDKGAVTAIGFNVGNGDVFFFQCSAQDQPGMTGAGVAKILSGFGCTTAVITSFISGENKTIANGMLYMGQMCEVPNGANVPQNLAYWYISKCPGFNNDFQKEIAELVQTTGQNAWSTYLLGVQIQTFSDRIDQNHKSILAEIERAMQAENWLQENINKEVNRAMQAEDFLQININSEVNRATAAEQAETERATQAENTLDTKIQEETARATQAEQELDQKITTETERATQAENKNASDIAAEKLRAQNRENQIQVSIDNEVAARIAADNDLINAIEQETLARRAADTALQNTIDATKKQLQQNINSLTDTVNGITGGQTDLPYLKLTGGTLSGPVTFSSEDTITVGRGPTAELEVATKKYVDDAISGGTTPGSDVTKEYVDQQIANVQSQISGKVSKTGDTMTGTLNMTLNQIQNAKLSSNTATLLDDGAGGPGRLSNLALPQNDADAASKLYVDTYVDEKISVIPTDGVQRSGDTMTGDLNFESPAMIAFYTTVDENNVMIASLNPNPTEKELKAQIRTATGRLSKTAKTLGITDELLSKLDSTGVDTQKSKIEAVYSLAATTAGISPTGTLAGQIYNSNGHIYIESLLDDIHLRGDSIIVQTTSGAYTNIQALALTLPQSGEIKGHSGHVDINSADSLGAVYINRTNNGEIQEGGTGELHVTGIHAPQGLTLEPTAQLILQPGTTIQVKTPMNMNSNNLEGVSSIVGVSPTIQATGGNLSLNSTSQVLLNAGTGTISANGKKINNVAMGTENTDAVTKQQLDAVYNTAESALNTANSASSAASSAQSTANTALGTAQNAQTNANLALSKANNAIELAGKVSGISMKVIASGYAARLDGGGSVSISIPCTSNRIIIILETTSDSYTRVYGNTWHNMTQTNNILQVHTPYVQGSAVLYDNLHSIRFYQGIINFTFTCTTSIDILCTKYTILG